MKSYYIYILLCSDGSYYTGISNDPLRRLYEHQKGLLKGCYTHTRRPLKLVYIEEYESVHDALDREKQIKGWTRKKKRALIDQNWDKLIKYAKSYTS